MKTKYPWWYLLFLAAGIIMINTSFSEPYYEDWKYTPVFMARSDLEQSVSFQPGARAIENPGKIYYKAPYIYINERYKGVHVINNSDPRNPVNESFIAAPGCIDMAIKGTILYIDNAIDFVAFDLSSKQVSKRIKDVFPEPLSPDNEYFRYRGDREDLVLVGWKKNPNYKGRP